MPDTARDVAWVKAIDRDVLIMLMMEKSMLKLGQPDLEVKLVVLVVLNAFFARVAGFAIEV